MGEGSGQVKKIIQYDVIKIKKGFQFYKCTVHEVWHNQRNKKKSNETYLAQNRKYKVIFKQISEESTVKIKAAIAYRQQ